MEDIKKSSTIPLSKKLGFSGIGLCALLCALPLIGGALGIGVLATVAAYFEKIGVGILLLSIGFLGYWVYKRRKVSNASAQSCDINCDCKTNGTESA